MFSGHAALSDSMLYRREPVKAIQSTLGSRTFSVRISGSQESTCSMALLYAIQTKLCFSGSVPAVVRRTILQDLIASVADLA